MRELARLAVAIKPFARVRLLGEDLIAFRDTNGSVGLVERVLPASPSSMFFGHERRVWFALRLSWLGNSIATARASTCRPNPARASSPPVVQNEGPRSRRIRRMKAGSTMYGNFHGDRADPSARPVATTSGDAALFPDRHVSKTYEGCNWLPRGSRAESIARTRRSCTISSLRKNFFHPRTADTAHHASRSSAPWTDSATQVNAHAGRS